MQISDPTDEDSVLLSVAESELFSRRYALGLGTRIPESLNERLRFSSLADWSEADRRALVDALREMHPSPLDPLLRLDVKWFEATLETGDFPDLRIVASRELQGLAPDRRLTTLVAELQTGKDTPDGEFSGAFRYLRREFRPALQRGRPCLAAATREGPFTIFEGLTRLAVILALSESGRPIPNAIPAYLGITDRLGEWEFAGAPASQGPGGG